MVVTTRRGATKNENVEESAPKRPRPIKEDEVILKDYFQIGQKEGGILKELKYYWPYPFDTSGEIPTTEDLFLGIEKKEKYDYYEEGEYTSRCMKKLIVDPNTTEGHPTFRFYFKKPNVYIYLRTSPNVLEKIGNQAILSEVAFLVNDWIDNNKLSHKLRGTEDFHETNPSDSLAIELRDYQKRSLSWMLAVEALEDSAMNTMTSDPKESDPIKIKLGDTGLCVDCEGDEYKLSNRPFEKEIILPNRRIKGGVLADNTGSGKTITCVALIHSNQFTFKHALRRNSNEKLISSSRIPSRATVVLTPKNLADQWVSEATRCAPTMKVHRIACIADYRELNWEDVILGDLLVVTFEFLANVNYRYYINNSEQLILEDLQERLPEQVSKSLNCFHFHRLIMDEFHELSGHNDQINKGIRDFSADYIWGMSGTLQLNNFTDLRGLCHYLKVDCPITNTSIQEFIDKFVRRNEPNLRLPPLEKEIIWVYPKPLEVYLRHVHSRELNTTEQIMRCCHYQTENVKDYDAPFLSIDEVTNRLVMEKKEIVERMRKACFLQQTKIQNLENDKDDKEGESEKRRQRENKELERLEAELCKAEKDHKTFELTFSLLRYGDEKHCLFCETAIMGKECYITICGHVHCAECYYSRKYAQQCGFCKKRLYSKENIIPIVFPDDTKDEEKLIAQGIDGSNYGSKLIAVYNYIHRTMAMNPNAKFILFLQFKKLSKFISSELDKMGIEHVRVHGNVFTHLKAIDRYKNCPSTRLVILSTEDSVSGLNLTETTHILILHPFYTGRGDQMDIAYEKQGIARAYRSGLDHLLKVVRFAVKGSIDESLTLKRQHLY